MPTTPTDFLNSAQQFLNSTKNEIDYRNAISRAYYAVYHHAKDWADKAGYAEYAGMSTHKGLAERFVQNKHKPEGYILGSLHKNRCRADYNISDVIESKEAEKHLGTCRSLMFKLK